MTPWFGIAIGALMIVGSVVVEAAGFAAIWHDKGKRALVLFIAVAVLALGGSFIGGISTCALEPHCVNIGSGSR